MSEFTDQAWNRIKKYEQDVIKVVFPNARFSQTQLFCNPDIPVKSFEGHFSSSDLFMGTPYQNSGDGMFLHFTSLPVLSQILNSGFLRMSEFNCLNDESEILFAQEVISSKTNSNKLKTEKSKMFSLSACESKPEIILDSHMWSEYGDDGKGCVLEYKYTSPKIFKMSFGKIQYGKRDLKPLKEIVGLVNSFAKKNEGFKINNLTELLTPIFAFHKDIKFQKEKEIRLFYYQDGSLRNDGPHINQYKDIYKNNQCRNFIKIYLKGKNQYVPYPGLPNEKALGVSPQIEITKIILGPNVKNEFDTIQQINRLKILAKQDFEIWNVNNKIDLIKIT